MWELEVLGTQDGLSDVPQTYHRTYLLKDPQTDSWMKHRTELRRDPLKDRRTHSRMELHRAYGGTPEWTSEQTPSLGPRATPVRTCGRTLVWTPYI